MIDMVERPPKYNGAFRRPLKLMAVYSLRNQQAVTCNTGVYTRRVVQRKCVLCMCLIPTYLPRKPFYFSPTWGSLSPRSLPQGRRQRDDDDSGGRQRQYRLFNSSHPRSSRLFFLHFCPSFLMCESPVALIKIPLLFPIICALHLLRPYINKVK